MSKTLIDSTSMIITILSILLSLVILLSKFINLLEYKKYIKQKRLGFSQDIQKDFSDLGNHYISSDLIVEDAFEKDVNAGESPCDWDCTIPIDSSYFNDSNSIFFSMRGDL